MEESKVRGRERRGRHIVTEKKGRKKRCKGKGEGEERETHSYGEKGKKEKKWKSQR